MGVKEIETLLIAFLRQEIFDDAVAIEPDTPLVEAGFDSFALLRLLHFAENRLSVCIPEGEITEERILNVHNLSEWIHGLGSEKKIGT